MLAKLNTFALVGIEAVPVEVEVDASAGLPRTVLVEEGLTGCTNAESTLEGRDRRWQANSHEEAGERLR
jgi:hypothetical protein